MMQSVLDMIVSNFIPFLAMMFVLVCVHELGHYLAARRAGVAVERFSFGFGRRLFRITDGRGTEWCISALPLGGYVKMRGEEPDGGGGVLDGTSLTGVPLRRRLLILVAGPLMNFVAAFGLFVGYAVVGEAVKAPPEIRKVVEGSPADAAGLRAGDVVTAVGGEHVETFGEVAEIIRGGFGDPVALTLERGGEVVTVSVDPDVRTVRVLGREQRIGWLGVRSVEPRPTEMSLAERLGRGSYMVVEVTRDTIEGIWNILSGRQSPEGIMGVVGIGHVTGVVIENSGLAGVLRFAGVVSISLAIVNLLPIPVTDGGQMLLVSWERVRGRRLSRREERVLVRASFVLLGGILAFTLVNDLVALAAYTSAAGG